MTNEDSAYANPESYDIGENDAGVAFYRDLARETGGPVLEIACGTGRVTIPIARLGFTVTGLDIVPGVLEQARRRSAGLPIRWVEGDGRRFSLDERFRLIFLTGNAFQQFLTNADQAALLDRVHAHLEDEGLFAFETRNPLWASAQTRPDLEALLEQARARGDFFALLETREQEQPWRTATDRAGREVRETIAQEYDPLSQILHLRGYQRRLEGGEERTRMRRETLRYTFPQELTALLHHHGFTVLRQYGDWNGEPLGTTSLSIIVVCGKDRTRSAEVTGMRYEV